MKIKLLEIWGAILFTIVWCIVISGISVFILPQGNGYHYNQAIVNQALFTTIILWRFILFIVRGKFGMPQIIFQFLILGICLLIVFLLIYTN